MKNIVLLFELWLRSASALIVWCIAALWYGFIFYLSHIPTTTSASTKTMVGGDDTLNVVFRFCAHLGVFGVLGVLVYAAMARNFVFVRRWYICALCITFLLGISDEVHQSFVAGRFGRGQDVLTDTAGAAMAIGIVTVLRGKLST